MGKRLTVGWLPVVLLMLLGLGLRWAALLILGASQPYLGALYAEFAGQLIAHHFLIPARVPFYSLGGIPFAYPPLPLYVEALALLLWPGHKFLVVNLLPQIVTSLTLPSFHVLTGEMRFDRRLRLLALAAFALFPSAIYEPVMGVGLAEAFGLLAMIWLAWGLVRALARPSITNHLVAGLLWALAVMASPGSAYLSPFLFTIFALVRLRKSGRAGLWRWASLMVLTLAVALAGSAVYWGQVIAHHGPQVFLTSLAGQHAPEVMVAQWLRTFVWVRLSGGNLSAFVLDLGILAGGLYWALHRRWLVVAWFVIALLIPREGQWLAAVPGAVLAAVGFDRVILPAVGSLVDSAQLRLLTKRLLCGTLVVFAAGNVLFLALLNVRQVVLTAAERQLPATALPAINWIGQHTPAGANVVVLGRWAVAEWTPQIARRTVINMRFGSEWEPAEYARLADLRLVLDSPCPNFGAILSALETDTGLEAAYVLVERRRLPEGCPQAGTGADFETLWQDDWMTVGLLTAAR